MPITVTPVRGRRDLDRFVALPFTIFAKDPAWVPPLRFERRRHLSARHNPFFAHAEAAFFLAWRSGAPVGRISAQVDRLTVRRFGPIGLFGMLDAIDDEAVFAALAATAESWLRARGMKRARGPLSLSINDEAGLLVDGFETPPALLMGHAGPWYGRHLAHLGYRKAMDLIAYDLDLAGDPLPVSARRLVERLNADRTVAIRGLRRADFAAELGRVMDVFNDAWSENWGFVPLTEAEMARLAADLRPLLRDDFVAIAEIGGEAAAFGIVLPNLNEALRDLHGRLLPFGWAKLLWRLKAGRIRSARLPLMGVRRRYHETPLGAALAYAVIDRLHRATRRAGLARAELSWILETNAGMRRIIEAAGGIPYKTYRVFEKPL